ncbi:MAG: methyltransferase domain-containing protein [Armatimonadetes bacterium]|nr:methyltransferase domain-containing protein [Armatimonadota bacterium]
MPASLRPSQHEYADRLQRHLAAQPGLPCAVLEAFAALPRHWFVDQLDGRDVSPETTDTDLLDRLYTDQALCIQRRGGVGTSSTSQPSLMALMMADVGLAPGQHVLEVGTGSGWNAGLMARVVGPTGRIVTLEVDAELAATAQAHLSRAAAGDRVTVRCADGLLGAPDDAPFDAIIVTVGCPDIPAAWLAQLADGGRLLMPYTLPDGSAPLLCLRRRGDRIAGRWLRWTWFVDLRGGGLAPWPAPREAGDHLSRRALPGAPWPSQPGDPRTSAHFDLWLLASDEAFTALRWAGRVLGGLWQPDGLAFCAESDLRWRGSAALADRLEQHCQQWLRAGSPRLTDYTVCPADPGPPGNALLLRRPTTPLWLCRA